MFSPNKEVQDIISPENAINFLKQGNERFLKNTPKKRNLLAHVQISSEGQYPFAVILSCIDSRVPTEIIFDQGIGNIFNVRIAGNIINEDILGSMEYACKVAGSKLIVILGHTKCGAVTAACKRTELGNITSLLSKINPAVDTIIGKNKTTEIQEKIEQVALENIKIAISEILEKSHILKALSDEKNIQVVGAMYEVETGKVRFLDA